jgi:5-methylcytosine-specific restriction endonuclease McrA
MTSKLVPVEIGPNGLPCRIFRTKEWKTCDSVQIMDRGKAVGAIRAQVYDRSEAPEGAHHECERCGRYITWESFEMNEKRPKGSGGGKTGGEVSLENSEALCHQCHQGSSDSAHGNRRWQSSKIKFNKGQND